MTRISLLQLKDDLDLFLKRAAAGEQIVIVDEVRPSIAWQLRAHDSAGASEVSSLPLSLQRQVSCGEARWAGGKPSGCEDPVQIQGKSTSQVVLEDRG